MQKSICEFNCVEGAPFRRWYYKKKEIEGNCEEEGAEQTENRALEFEYSKISRYLFDANFTVSKSELTIK